MKTTKEEIKNRLRVTDLVPRIVCVLIAVILWLYVMSNESPDYERTFSGVNVGIENTALLMSQSDLSVMSGMASYVDITVTGKRGDVVSYSLDDISASVDVSGVTEGDIIKRSDKYIYYLSSGVLRVYSIAKEESERWANLI